MHVLVVIVDSVLFLLCTFFVLICTPPAQQAVHVAGVFKAVMYDSQ